MGASEMSVREFGSLLREFRVAAGLSQEALAERARLSPGAISTLERSARRAPQHQTLALLVEALQLDADARAQFEASADVGRRRSPRARTGATPSLEVPQNLPRLLTSFHGRAREVAEIETLIASRRLVTLLGAGGVGKTRLATEVAHRQLEGERFPGGIWFVDFAPMNSAGLVAASIARLLNVRERPGEPLSAEIARAIATKRMLLVFDNCEHVVDECARVAETLLRDCPGLVVLTTTREALRLDGECVLRVQPLPYDEHDSGGPALALLLDRLAEADFTRYAQLSDIDRTHAAAICKRLDGIPLAIELAAGRARDLPLAHIVAGLDERFGLLTLGRRTASPRQHTLRGMIDWSFEPLPPAERDLFARLGLFAGAFTPEAAGAICGDDARTVRSGLATLISKSLVSVVEDRNGRMRYRLLETMRAYALDRLRERNEFDRYARRFAEYFCALAKEADARYGRVTSSEFLASVETDLDNFRAALEWSLGQRNDPQLGAELAGAMGWIYRQSALFVEGSRWAERGLAEVRDGSPMLVGRLHMALSIFCLNTGDMQRGLRAAELATEAYRSPEAGSQLSWSRAQECACLAFLGRTDEARRAIEEAVDVARKHHDMLRLANALNALALTIPIDRASERFAPLEESIRTYRAASPDGAMVPIGNLAETYFATGDCASALACGLEAIAMARTNRDRSFLAGALTNVAAYALAAGDVEQADRTAREAMLIARDIESTHYTMCAFEHLGSVAARRGEFERAARLLGASDARYREFGIARGFTEQSLYDRSIALIRDAIGEERLLLLLDEGSAVPVERAIDEALLRAVSDVVQWS
jgi:predicted ATPase/DNA-binding XRE family transcriptional regulator